MTGSDFELGLEDPARSGVYFVDDGDLDALAAATRDTGLSLRRVDLSGCRDKRALLPRFAVALDIPGGRGHNWDGLADDLRDLGWIQGDGHVLLLEDAVALHDAPGTDFDTLLGILEDAATAWAARGIPFRVFIALPESAFAALEDDT
jgi:hypothetical protein